MHVWEHKVYITHVSLELDIIHGTFATKYNDRTTKDNMKFTNSTMKNMWLGGIVVGCRTCDL